jgi:hypothetical protein
MKAFIEPPSAWFTEARAKIVGGGRKETGRVPLGTTEPSSRLQPADTRGSGFGHNHCMNDLGKSPNGPDHSGAHSPDEEPEEAPEQEEASSGQETPPPRRRPHRRQPSIASPAFEAMMKSVRKQQAELMSPILRRIAADSTAMSDITESLRPVLDSIAKAQRVKLPFDNVSPPVTGAYYSATFEEDETQTDEDPQEIAELVREDFDTGELTDDEIAERVRAGRAEYTEMDASERQDQLAKVVQLLEFRNDIAAEQLAVATTHAQAAEDRAEKADDRAEKADQRASRAETRANRHQWASHGLAALGIIAAVIIAIVVGGA